MIYDLCIFSGSCKRGQERRKCRSRRGQKDSTSNVTMPKYTALFSALVEKGIAKFSIPVVVDHAVQLH